MQGAERVALSEDPAQLEEVEDDGEDGEDEERPVGGLDEVGEAGLAVTGFVGHGERAPAGVEFV